MNERSIPEYPDSLLDWAGHRDGGVKKPFYINSGRPTGNLIETNLTRRLRRWTNELSTGQVGVPIAMFLIGGPGNGKTDAIESVVTFLDEALGNNYQLLGACKAKFDVELPPRKLVVDLADIVDKTSTLHGRKLVIIQDATEVDLENAGKTPESLFLNDVESLVKTRAKDRPLFLCGINRGILAHAVLVGHTENRDPAVLKFIDTLTGAATSGSGGKACWPLDGYEWAVGWPMDVESLVDHSFAGDSSPPASQILEKVLESGNWTLGCEAGDLCPFHANQSLLSSPQTRKHFVRILHFYELVSGKRWNFRDLFSLVSHVLVGHESTFVVNNQRMPPCEWAAHHARKARGTGPEAILSAWALASRLYMHALFPAWPKLDNVAKQTRDLYNDIAGVPPELEQFFTDIASERYRGTTEIGRLLGEDFCLALDPADTRRELVIRGELTVGQVEDAYTTSIFRGLELTREYLEKIELLLVELLSKVDEACEPNGVSPLLHSKAKCVQWHLRALASRFVKRGFACGAGICRDFMFLEHYEALLDGTGDSARRLKKSFQDLLGDGQPGLSISLSTTFGQPLDSKWGRAYLVGSNKPRIKTLPITNIESRPREQLPYLQIQNLPVPVTFPLFKALSEVDQGLMAASLPAEIFALVDGTRNVLAGQYVRDEEWLEDARIVIGESKQNLVVEDGNIKVER